MDKAKEYRRQNRQNVTSAELRVFGILKKLFVKFESQKVFRHANGFYIVDFYIRQPYKICLEIDGNQHLSSRVNYDVARTLVLEDDKKRKVIRFRNDEVMHPMFEQNLKAELEKNKLHYLKRNDIPIWALGKRRKYWDRTIQTNRFACENFD